MLDPVKERWGLISGGVLVLVVLLSFAFCRNKEGEIPKADAATADSLKFTAPAFHVAQDSGKLQVARTAQIAQGYAQQAQRATISARVAHGKADSLAGVAERLASVANRLDSVASAWQAAFVAEKVEADSLRVAAARSDTAYQEERQARIQITALYAADTLRRVQAEALIPKLEADVKAAGSCHIPGTFSLVGCPSRKAVVVAGAVIAEGVRFLLTKKP